LRGKFASNNCGCERSDSDRRGMDGVDSTRSTTDGRDSIVILETEEIPETDGASFVEWKRFQKQMGLPSQNGRDSRNRLGLSSQNGRDSRNVGSISKVCIGLKKNRGHLFGIVQTLRFQTIASCGRSSKRSRIQNCADYEILETWA
jgi:hypothetical protein